MKDTDAILLAITILFSGFVGMIATWMNGGTQAAVGLGIVIAYSGMFFVLAVFTIELWRGVVRPFCKRRGWIGGDEE